MANQCVNYFKNCDNVKNSNMFNAKTPLLEPDLSLLFASWTCSRHRQTTFWGNTYSKLWGNTCSNQHNVLIGPDLYRPLTLYLDKAFRMHAELINMCFKTEYCLTNLCTSSYTLVENLQSSFRSISNHLETAWYDMYDRQVGWIEHNVTCRCMIMIQIIAPVAYVRI